MTPVVRRLLIGTVTLAGAPPALAETVVQEVTVTALMEASCTASSATLNFGTYDPASTQAVESTVRLELDCPDNTPVLIRLDGGRHQQGDDRRMAGGGEHFLRYNLYVGSPAAGRIWGDGQGFGEPLSWFHISTEFPHVSGRLPAGQPVAAGLYTDIVTITVDIDG